MKRFVLVLSLIAVVAGWTHQRIVRREPTGESKYLEGFMDGYHGAHPDAPYAKDVEPTLRSRRSDAPEHAYSEGWKAGYKTGRKDVEQQE